MAYNVSMTGRTHDLAAFTALNGIFVISALTPMSLATLVVTLGANFIGGLAPDLDKSSSKLWGKIRGGRLISRIISPVMGGHRLISHSLLGLIIGGLISYQFLEAIKHVLIVDNYIVWIGFMSGLVSHLVTDSMTKVGIPIFFPFNWRLGLPPIRKFRITTGGRVESSLIYPGLMLLNGYWFFKYSDKYLDFLRHYIG